MQKLSVIIGQDGEGKTTELLDEYYLHFVGTAFHAADDGSPVYENTRDKITPVVIICGFERPEKPAIAKYIENLGNANCGINDHAYELLIKKINEFKEGDHKYYEEVSELGMLENIIASNIKDKDCVFYIDNIDKLYEDGISDVNDLVNMISRYPNVEVGNSFDIVATISKRK